MNNNLEEKINFLKNLIKKQNIIELDHYMNEIGIKFKDLNNENFDILIYSIENNVSEETLQYIIKECPYDTLNYTINDNNNLMMINHFGNYNYKTPLLSAIMNENFKMATFLIKNKADINYRITDFNSNCMNIITYLCSINYLNNKKLNYILSHGFHIKSITTNVIVDLINYKVELSKNDLLEMIFHHYIYDSYFILNLLYYYKNNRRVSNKHLQNLIRKEKNKIEINDIMYDQTINSNFYKNLDAIYILFSYDGSEPSKLFSRIHKYEILEMTIIKNDYYLLEKILYTLPWHLNSSPIDFEKILILAIQKGNIDIIMLLFEFLFHSKPSLYDLNNIQHIEYLLLKANEKRNIDVMLLLIYNLLLNPQSVELKLSFKTIVILTDFYNYLYKNPIYNNNNNNNNNIKKIKKIQSFIKNLLNRSSLDLTRHMSLYNVLWIMNIHDNLHGNINDFLNNNILNPNLNFEFLSSIYYDKNNNHSSLATIDKMKVIHLLIDNLINITINTIDQLNYSIIQEKIIPYILYLLNISIKLENFNIVKNIIDNEKLKKFLNINTKDINHQYPIVIAYNSFKNDNKIFNYLLDHDANINEKINQDISLFEHAIQNRNYKILQCILKHGIHLEEKEILIYNRFPFPLVKTILHNDLEKVKSIVINNSYRLDVYSFTNIRIDYSKCLFPPLILSYILNYKEIFKFLIKYANINDLDRYGYSLLHYAILKEDVETINYLINHDVNINYKENKEKYGHSALDISILIDNKEVFSTLLNSKNILFNIPNWEGDLPLSTIIKSSLYSIEDKEKMMLELIKRGSYVNFIDVNLPLKDAILENKLSLVKILVENEASVNFIYEKNGYTPLLHAIEAKSFEIVKYLVEKGADVNYILPYQKQENVKETILLRSIEIGELKIFEYLLEHHAVLNFDNKYENYRLIEAIDKSGKINIFEYLIKHNINHFLENIIESIIFLNKLDLLKVLITQYNYDPNSKDCYGNVPLIYAIRNSNEYMIDYLIYWGSNIYNKKEYVNNLGFKYAHRLRGHPIYKKLKNYIIHKNCKKVDIY
ncbi:ankyrin [Anaeromyces robustus]|uniref:Ankyrin n=1 Tax=Anaeromyces robustus TaxID=1754192 RepID=A0A1Y1WRL2_9FUNG|nr:ankyrin [Anaeromyces robustus]|eukprot:ORX76180.1 ankyrin [Anaeromyces robustus]